MDRLLAGMISFQQRELRHYQDLFASLDEGQFPHTLMITCSDSRIDPHLITQSEPGELFVLRNVGNMVPAYESSDSCTAAAIEFAIAIMKVKNIVVCGHTKCAAMQGLMSPESVAAAPSVQYWLIHGKQLQKIIQEKFPFSREDERWNLFVQQNVIHQIKNLKTHPSIQDAISNGQLKISGFVFQINSGTFLEFDSESNDFQPLI